MARDIFPSILEAITAPEIMPFFAVELMFQSNTLRMWSGYSDVGLGEDIAANQIQAGQRYTISFVGDTDFTLIGADSNTLGLDFLATGAGSGTGTVNYTYLGAGQLLNISTVEETTEIQAVGANFTLSGIPSDFISLALQEPYQGRECRIYFGVFLSGNLATQGLDTITTQFGDLIILQSGTQGLLEIFSGEMDQMNIMEASETATISVSAENALIKLERPVVRRLTSTDQKSRYPNDKGLEFVANLQDKEIFWGRKGAPQ